MRTLLQLKKIHKAYGAHVILDHASVTISEDQKIGVIGRNGAGKSTLCKIITGEEEQDSGTVGKSADFRLAYLEQEDSYKLDETVSAFLMRYTGKEAWQCGKMAARFQLKNELLETEIGVLSGGFRTRVKLTSMLLRDPNFLVLDEPSNYLDLKTLILLEEFLKGFHGGFLVVSHDREFLKKTCQHTLEIENGECYLYPGTVEQYLIFKEEQNQMIENYNKNVLAKKKHLMVFVTRFGAKASKASQARSKMKQIERLKTIETAHPLSNVRIKIPDVEKRNSMAFRCDELAIGYPEKIIASGIHMEFDQGAHIAILGDNGQGKTTFMRTIAGDLDKKHGSFRWGHRLKTAYYGQHIFSLFDSKNDVYTCLSDMAAESVTRQEILNLAGSFLFKGNDILKKIAVLSGGEKARVCLAGLLLTKSEVLLLDEPTNHLDFETVEALGRALKAYHGTIFFISHDRTFVNLLATDIIEIKEGKLERYPGNYEEYVYRMAASVRSELTEKARPAGRPIAKKVSNKRLLRRLKAERVQLNSKIRKIQAGIDHGKKEQEAIYQSYSDEKSSWSQEHHARYKHLEKTIRESEDRWLVLNEQMDALTQKIEKALPQTPR